MERPVGVTFWNYHKNFKRSWQYRNKICFNKALARCNLTSILPLIFQNLLPVVSSPEADRHSSMQR